MKSAKQLRELDELADDWPPKSFAIRRSRIEIDAEVGVRSHVLDLGYQLIANGGVCLLAIQLWPVSSLRNAMTRQRLGSRPAFASSSAAIRWLVLLLSSLSVVSSAVQHVVIGDVSTRDTSKPMYDVVFPPLGGRVDAMWGRAEPAPGGETMRVVSARGQAMDCVLPPPPPPLPLPNSEMDETHDVFDGVEELLDEYRGKCFRREEGWWHYVFCYGMSVEQLHVSTGKNDEGITYLLGKLHPEYDAERRRNGGRRPAGSGMATVGVSDAERRAGGTASPASSPDPDAPFTQLYGNGTICDVNGKTREITVKYKCNQDAMQLGGGQAVAGMNFISALREIETCIYEIDFVNEQICKHPTYKNKLENNILRINCAMAEEEGPFEGLSSSSYPKAVLNL